ncbi:MAG TPA: triose-phosphate isomerase [Methanocorpusculum sp.]|nr:triose-phosphate isomerase [Methanocorpusculum sp.]HJJ90079.1 triose-phosphate isomerase [Methanocorpusculum sp.]HJJ90556.1 triose-phosphate isomerase [Methanocorpusculum sp.]HJK00763.1 triose-phosphate isomerase [Methanocorpusculum sp.]HJK02150.1 triose-phosphate isomerase [Methanocorpusculum sp.]
MVPPLILINFKSYREGSGNNAAQICSAAETVMQESGVIIGVAPQFTELHQFCKHYDIPVYSQHIDPIEGAFTGHIPAFTVREAGCTGTLINHSERCLSIADIEATVTAAKIHQLESVVCTNNVAVSAAVALFAPTYIAIEPPELIGSGISVAKTEPDIILGTVDAVNRINSEVHVLCGAGIQSGECVKNALSLGTDGVLIASSVVKAQDPEIALWDLVSLL